MAITRTVTGGWSIARIRSEIDKCNVMYCVPIATAGLRWKKEDGLEAENNRTRAFAEKKSAGSQRPGSGKAKKVAIRHRRLYNDFVGNFTNRTGDWRKPRPGGLIRHK